MLEPTGAETQVIGRLGEEPVSAAFRERPDAVPGSTLRVSPEPGQVHLFDAAGTRIG